MRYLNSISGIKRLWMFLGSWNQRRLYFDSFQLALLQFMVEDHQYISRKDETDKVVIFERGKLVFVFNFHWEKSYTDYRVGCIKPGKYRVNFERLV